VAELVDAPDSKSGGGNIVLVRVRPGAPSVDLRGTLTSHQVIHRAAIIEPAGIGALLRATDGFEGQPTTRAALQLAVYVRPGELRHAGWKEFNMDAAV
jgi:hypothetical protein